jgi:hypothetical protein
MAVRYVRPLTIIAALIALAMILPAHGYGAKQGARQSEDQREARPYLHAESGRSFARLQDAVNAIGAGRGTILIAPGVHRDCAVQTAGHIAFVAAQPGTAIFDGKICEGKAALVLRGDGARVDGLLFQNLRVPDGNGAGIRLEKSDLSVVNSVFRGSEQGILTADDPSAGLIIDRSTFSRLGRCDRGLACAHSVYTGHYGRVTVTRSRFERGSGGHYLKSRAAHVDVHDNSFDDSQGRGTNYLIDLPGGATGRIAGNLFIQGRDKDNFSALITVAPEGRRNRSAGLVIERNRASLPDGLTRRSAFVADWSGEALALGPNDLDPALIPFMRR